VFSRLRSNITYANVASSLALFVAMGTGGAYAANTIGSDDIIDESIQSVDVKNGQIGWDDLALSSVTGSRIKDESIFGADITNGTIATADLATGAVNGATVLDNSLTADDLATSSVTSAEIASDAVGATEITDNSIDGGEIVDGSLGAVELSTSSVGSEELATGAVIDAKIGSNAVNGSKVANNSLTSADLAGTDINGTIQIPTGTVANGRCGNYSIGVGGAKAGEAVVITNKAALQNGLLIYGSRVPTDGTVTMTLCNMSGGTQAALVDFPIRIITFG
jgi:hypothetical protein